jgi:tetratricopeptide (TPR) repeat protein
MSKWYQLTYDSLENRSLVLEKQMIQQADQTIDIAKKFTKNKNTEAVGYLYWAGSLGAKAWHAVARHQWVRAYFLGKKGFGYLNKVIHLNPQLYDVYLGLGMYEYYAATLGPVLKALSSFLIRGDRQRALDDLHTAETKSRYVKLEAAYFTWNAALDEGRFGDALEKMKVLNRAFPQSALFNWCEIQTLFFQKKWQAVLQKSQTYIAKAQIAPQPEGFKSRYQLLLAKVYYHCGAAAFNLHNPDLAKNYFEKAIAQPADFLGWRALAHLRMGQILDLENKRDQAVMEYKEALEFPDFWDSRKQAKKYKRHPFTLEELGEDKIFYSPLQTWKEQLP